MLGEKDDGREGTFCSNKLSLWSLFPNRRWASLLLLSLSTFTLAGAFAFTVALSLSLSFFCSFISLVLAFIYCLHSFIHFGWCTTIWPDCDSSAGGCAGCGQQPLPLLWDDPLLCCALIIAHYTQHTVCHCFFFFSLLFPLPSLILIPHPLALGGSGGGGDRTGQDKANNGSSCSRFDCSPRRREKENEREHIM